MQVEKTPLMLRTEAKFGKDLEEILREEYGVKKQSTRFIAKKLGTHAKVICEWLRKHNITVRTNSETRFIKPSKEQLYKWYVVEERSTHYIAKKLGTHAKVICEWLRKHNITVRTNSETRLPSGTIKPSKEQLYKWYVVEERSTHYIAKKFGSHAKTICEWLRKYGIPIRNYNSSCNKDAVKDLLRCYVGEKKYASAS